MTGFLKVFVRGIVCLVLLPFILLVWVLYGVYCLFAFIYMLFKSIILFFTGANPSGEMPEDIEAKRILLEREQTQVEQAQVVSMMYQNMTTQQQLLNQQQEQLNQERKEIPNNDFDPFTPSPEEVSDPFGNDVTEENNEPTNKEGGYDDGQSY